MISMYHQGLNPNIYWGLAASKLYTMADAIQVACQMEEETKKKALMRALVASNIRSERTIVDANWEKFVDKSRGNSYPPNKNAHSSASSSQGTSSSNSRIKCHGLGHVFSMSFKTNCCWKRIFLKQVKRQWANKGTQTTWTWRRDCEPLNANL